MLPVVAVFVAIGCVLIITAALALYRFCRLRSSGAPALIRALPAKDSHSWRHGVVRYSPTELQFFMLRSVGIKSDIVIARRDVEILGYRQLDDVEVSFMTEVNDVVQLRCGDREFEVASDRRSVMALHAWVESAPSKRREAVDYQTLRRQRNA